MPVGVRVATVAREAKRPAGGRGCIAGRHKTHMVLLDIAIHPSKKESFIESPSHLGHVTLRYFSDLDICWLSDTHLGFSVRVCLAHLHGYGKGNAYEEVPIGGYTGRLRMFAIFKLLIDFYNG